MQSKSNSKDQLLLEIEQVRKEFILYSKNLGTICQKQLFDNGAEFTRTEITNILNRIQKAKTRLSKKRELLTKLENQEAKERAEALSAEMKSLVPNETRFGQFSNTATPNYTSVTLDGAMRVIDNDTSK